MNYFKKKTILITGGTGSFGNKFLKEILINKSDFKKIIIFSRDELKQSQMQEQFKKFNKKIRYFIGDIRDKERLRSAFENVDIVVHAAALKQVPTAEYNPIEFIKTNILGAQNIIEVALEKSVKKVIALSTDKATAPVNLYGATKLCADKLFLAANNASGDKKTIFSVLRYGNVMMSRGSVIPIFLKIKKNEIYPVTSDKMTRFSITLSESVQFCLSVIKISKGAEIFIPKLKSYRIIDLIKSINSKAKMKIIGVREGEKLDEELISSHDSNDLYDIGKYYVFCNIQKYKKNYIKSKKVSPGFSYNSRDNNFYSINELKKIIKKEKDFYI
ncbi:UDP-N-acetylglucosamine 4,6-dehydratase (inverting) [Candidatus Pelagibacter sp.]|nr:UDP-N-acetylglucosamine 4,6-dehydratase (inverting) [Candidatus Pelagibacter sp.]